jgi:3-dehydroquinate synthase
MKTIELKIPVSEKVCPLKFFAGKSDLLVDLQKIRGNFTRALVVTDENVWQAQKDFFVELDLEVFILPAGEESKNLENLTKLTERISRENLDRQSLLIGIGGGVVTDLTGFAASIYQRGISFVLVPTSLLAMVDAGIGGKTGIDTDWGKNQLGTFAFPETVLICPEFLATLPEKELRNGLAEMLKHGIIANKKHFSDLAEIISRDFDWEKIAPFIKNSVEIKTNIVQSDSREKSGERIKLNLGHTFAHAIEAVSNYEIPHGQAVAIGLKLSAKFGEKLGIADHKTVDEISMVINQLFPRKNDWDLAELWKYMTTDKKRKDEIIQFIIPRKIGEVVVKEVAIDKLG